MSNKKNNLSAQKLRIIRFGGVLLFIGSFVFAFIFTGNDRFLRRCVANGNSIKYCNEIYEDRKLAFKEKELEREKRRKEEKELKLEREKRRKEKKELKLAEKRIKELELAEKRRKELELAEKRIKELEIAEQRRNEINLESGKRKIIRKN